MITYYKSTMSEESYRVTGRSRSSVELRRRPIISVQKYREGSDDDDDDDDDEDEVDDEMTLEEKQSMYTAVKLGDIDRLEELLEKPNGDIKMIMYNENLIMTAIRNDQEEMAEFLLDNGADPNYTLLLIGNPEAGLASIEKYEYTCRQMAYDHGMYNIVEIIDVMNNDLFPGVKPRHRTPRYRREKPPTPHLPTPDVSDFREQDSDSSAKMEKHDKVNKMKRVDKVKRKTKKLMKRVSADLISLLDDSDDSDAVDSKSQTSWRTHSSGAKSLRRRRRVHSSSEDVNKSKPTKSASNHSVRSMDRDSGVFSVEPEKFLTQRSTSSISTTQNTERAVSKTPQKNIKDTKSSAKKSNLPSIKETGSHRDMNTKFQNQEEKADAVKPTFKLNKKFRPKLYHGKHRVARASKPMYPFQYVTDHSRCRTRGAYQESNPKDWKKVHTLGSYCYERDRWSAVKSADQAEYINLEHCNNSAKKLYSSQSYGQQSTDANDVIYERKSDKHLFIDVSLSKRKLNPSFRRAYTSMDFVTIPIDCALREKRTHSAVPYIIGQD
ncbi:uncharacterized protein LOC126827889 [Patella vulgata]|uniref:uncharacterized protein LOC126827889 n=1 Tax=Patella vulgata TaxID=6465 RepID=UPI0021809617|nr:uncharacterized protein LOC126827889 [Patella vulgata]